MKRRTFITLSSLLTLSSCAKMMIDPYNVLLRSDRIRSQEDADLILSAARKGWTADGRVRVLYLKGDPYEIGYQHGALLRREVQDNIGTLYKKALDVFISDEFFAETYERIRPYIPDEYVEEMRGLAHGAKIPLSMLHHVHALPSMSEWGGRKRIRKIAKEMIYGDLGTSCSNFAAGDSVSKDGSMYVVRVLDWGLHKISKLYQYPLISVVKPNKGIPYANITWVGFIGAISGMNAEGITLGEMGYGDTDNETLMGKPMPFLLREVMQYASNLKDVRKIISESPGTNSFGFLMSDGKNGEAELYIRDPDRFLIFKPGEGFEDIRKNKRKSFPPIENIVYGGHYDEKMANVLSEKNGDLTLDLLKNYIIPEIVMKSNFQNVIYDPRNLQFWVSNAGGKKIKASEMPYSHFDLSLALSEI